ncbi:hypothetical protein B0H63DRAFT_540546 [Podospora didyma]|uniref:C2H2-type domain-containing protein n=1 Tax=Podospora didyma TaxID=330526 RepID=A0AAE0NRY2_9PEZI|nr:hypothetical protein B0H63DRAFT_540546 [Podospora didyma]
MEWEIFWERAALETISSVILSGRPSLPSASMSAFQFYTVGSSTKLIGEELAGIPSESNHKKFGAPTSAKVLASQFIKMLEFSATLDTTDPRDRVFALAALFGAFGINIPKPDYLKPTEMVFQELLGMLKTTSVWPPRQPLAPPSQYPSQGLALLVRNENLDQHPAGNRQNQTENSYSPKAIGTASGASTQQSYHAFFDHILQHHKRLLFSDILHRLAARVPHGPLICLDGEDPATTREDEQASGSQLGAVHGRSAAAKERSVAKRKRQGGPRKRGEEDNEDDEEEGDERQHKKRTADPWNRLACPYFQRDLDCPRLSTSCRGPGEHLYRVHHIHPCLRCGQIFESREALSQHLQSVQPCNLVHWRPTFNPSQGFEDPQKEKLGKKTVRTWQQIFGILFPHYSNTGFVQLLDQFHQHYVLECQRILPQRLANDSSTFHELDQGQQQQGRLEAYVLQLVSEIFDQILGSFRRELVRTPPSGVHEFAPRHARGDEHIPRPAAPLPQEEPVVQATLQSMHQLRPEDAMLDPVLAFGEYLSRVAPAGTFDQVPHNPLGDLQDVENGREGNEWTWEHLGLGSG